MDTSYILHYIHKESAVGTATGYGLKGSRFESRRRLIFRTHPERPRGPPNLPYTW